MNELDNVFYSIMATLIILLLWVGVGAFVINPVELVELKEGIHDERSGDSFIRDGEGNVYRSSNPFFWNDVNEDPGLYSVKFAYYGFYPIAEKRIESIEKVV